MMLLLLPRGRPPLLAHIGLSLGLIRPVPYLVPIDNHIPPDIPPPLQLVAHLLEPPITGHGSDETGRKKSSSSKKPGWFEKMRDQLQRGEEIRWYVVVNGDEVRDWPDEPERRPEMSKRRMPTKEQKQHHAQYTLQQQIFKEGDRERGESFGRGETFGYDGGVGGFGSFDVVSGEWRAGCAGISEDFEDSTGFLSE